MNQLVATAKGETTRTRILDSALELFATRGYAETTMRDIAKKAGTSLGNSYYYFPSKEHFVQAFYEKVHAEHLQRCREILPKEKKLKSRLRAVTRALIDVIAPYQQMSGDLFRTAADPRSPINPFSEQSKPTRDRSMAVFKEMVETSSDRLSGDLKSELPPLLWLYHMSIILFWIHDRSEGCKRTYALVDDTSELVMRLISLWKLPGLKKSRRQMLGYVLEMLQIKE
jgi:AcrR family transcriptional regulator